LETIGISTKYFNWSNRAGITGKIRAFTNRGSFFLWVRLQIGHADGFDHVRPVQSAIPEY